MKHLEIITLSEKIAGEYAPNVVDCLLQKKEINEFKISEITELKVAKVRSILYKLQTEGLVSSERKKDKEKKMYASIWTLNKKRCIQKYNELMELESNEIKRSTSED